MFDSISAPTPSRQGAVRSRRSKLAAASIAAAMFLAACGSSDDDTSSAAADDAPAASSEVTVAIGTGSTEAGDVLVTEDGLSLYGFLPDEGGTATCGGGCAEAWPPIMLTSADLPEGLDASIFSVTDAADGGSQLVAGGWPLYLFAGDASAGDIAGQGSGGNWFLVAPDGSLISEESAASSPAPAAEETQGSGY